MIVDFTSSIIFLHRTEKSRVVTVSSGGMLVQKLDTSDLQFENMNPFDGTMAYAQNKRQQVMFHITCIRNHVVTNPPPFHQPL